MASQIVAAVGRKKTPKKGIPKGKLKSFDVTMADNGGVMVRSRHHVEPPKRDKKGGLVEPYDYDAGMHEATFGDAAAAHKHMGQLMGLGAPAAAADGEGAPGAKPAADNADEEAEEEES